MNLNKCNSCGAQSENLEQTSCKFCGGAIDQPQRSKPVFVPGIFGVDPNVTSTSDKVRITDSDRIGPSGGDIPATNSIKKLVIGFVAVLVFIFVTGFVTVVYKDYQARAKFVSAKNQIVKAQDQSSTVQQLEATSTSENVRTSTSVTSKVSAPATIPVPVSESLLVVAGITQADNLPFSPSFDCAKAATSQERLICEDRELSKFDVELSQAYLQARTKVEDKNKLKSEQLEWFKYSRNSCLDKPCMINAYKSRISELRI